MSFIEREQLSDGSFLRIADNAAKEKTIFITALILTALGQDSVKKEKSINTIVTKGLAFLLNEKNPHQVSWNYWPRKTKEIESITGAPERAQIPDDLDDTFTVLAAISLHSTADDVFPTSSDFFSGKTMAEIVRLLCSTETRPSGPYNTWIIGAEGVWQDIDPIVNANIAYFLTLKGIRLPKIEHYIATTIEQILGTYSQEQVAHSFGAPISRYYFSPVVMLYFLTRPQEAAASRVTAFLLAQLAKTDPRTILNPLETIMAISSILRLYPDKNSAVNAVTPFIKTILSYAEKQTWRPHPLYIETAPKNIPSYAGAAALTAAFCVEALSSYQHLTNESKKKTKTDNDTHVNSAHKIETEILTRFAGWFDPFPSIAPLLPSILKKVISIDPGKQITLLPYFFNRSLARPSDDCEYIIDLGIANLAGWIAYRIFDDISDSDAPISAATTDKKTINKNTDIDITAPFIFLPLAAMCLRHVTATYTLIFEKEESEKENPQNNFALLFKTLMSQMDEANAWEARHLSISTFQILHTPEKNHNPYDTLAHKSLPHCLGPIAILARSGYAANDPAIADTISFFHHYLIARQLHDDAHDWYDDLSRGSINSAASKIIKHKNITSTIASGETLGTIITKHKDLLYSIFWNETIPKIVEDIDRHIALAETSLRSLEGSGVLASTTYLQSLLDPLKKSAHETLSGRVKTLDFLKIYASNTNKHK